MYSLQAVSRQEISAFLEQGRGLGKHYIGTKVLPIHTVTARAGRYPRTKLATANTMKREQTKRSSSGSYNETTSQHEWDTYDCEDRGLEERIDDSKAAEMKSFFDLEKITAANVTRKCELEFEINAAGLIMNEANFAKTDATVAMTEANIDSIDLPQDINAAIELVCGRGEDVNTMVFSQILWNRLRRSKLLQDYLYGKIGGDVNKRLIGTKDLQTAFALDMDGKSLEIHIARAKYDVAPKGRDTASLLPIWGNDYIWVGDVKSGDFANGGAGRTLVWDADIPSGLYATETYRNEGRRSDMVRVRTNSIEKMVNENAGQLIKTNYA
jgi:hypothetical protein